MGGYPAVQGRRLEVIGKRSLSLFFFLFTKGRPDRWGGLDGDTLYIHFSRRRQTRPAPATGLLDEIVSQHREIASRDNLSAEFFAAIDERYETDGALIARAPPDQDSFRCKGPAAGEILGWIYLGFMTWDEAKDFAGR